MIRLLAAPRAAFDPLPTLLRGGLLVGLLLLLLTGIARPAPAGPLEAVVGVRAVIPADARTAPVLGTARAGSGVVIDDDGLVLTIGYLILEAASAEITLHDGSPHVCFVLRVYRRRTEGHNGKNDYCQGPLARWHGHVNPPA